MGNLYENFGMEASFVFCSASALIVTIIAFFIKEEKVVVTEAEAEAQAVPKAASQSKSLIDLYKSPVFWLILLATFLGNAVLRPLLSYSSIYFPNYGLSISTTATVVSLLGLASGSFNMFLNCLLYTSRCV